MEREAKLAKAMVDAYVRASRDKMEAAGVIADKTATKSVRLALNPPRAGSALKKTGVLLILAPDPFTGVAGVALIGASYMMKRREAAGLEELVNETARTMRELRSMVSLANNS